MLPFMRSTLAREHTTMVLREADADLVLLDGSLAEGDRVGDGRADYGHCVGWQWR